MRSRLCALAALLLAAPAFAQDFAPVETAMARGDHGKIVALAVEQHGKPVEAWQSPKLSPDRLHDIRSAGKSITALAVGIAIADGKLALDTRVWTLLGVPASDPRADITVRDLLAMSSGLDCDDETPRSPGNEERMYRTRDWRAFALSIPLARDLARDGKGFRRFSYCTAGVFLLGQAVQQATGERFDLFVQRRLFDPLGIASVEWKRSPTGQVQSGGQIGMTAADLLKLGRLVLDGGAWKDRQLVPAAWIKEMLQPHRQVGPYIFYGYLWWFTPVRAPSGFQPTWYMSGNGGNIVAIFRDYDAVVAVQSANYNKPDSGRQSFAIVESVLARLSK